MDNERTEYLDKGPVILAAKQLRAFGLPHDADRLELLLKQAGADKEAIDKLSKASQSFVLRLLEV